MSVDQSGSARTFFNITELVTITFDFLETSQCVPLLRISHSCFSVAALRVWADISDAQILLALLVGIHVEDSPFAEHDSGKVFSIRGDVNFQRFNVYAPFVKYLNVYGNEHRHFIIKDWRPLFLRAQQTPLLPNLMTLTLYAIDSRFAYDQLLWISAFASPSLIRFTPIHIVDSNKCLISYVATSIILKTITERCPNLQSLALYPQKRAGDMYSDGESCLLNLILVTPFFQYLRSLTNIRQLSASLSLIDADGLLAIGNLPQLEQLSIRGCDDYLEKKNFSIPDASFLQLRNLTLEDLYIDQIADLMTIKPLARNLLSVSFCHRFGAEDEETRISWFTDGLPRLLQYTSCLTHLSYDATYGSRLDWNHFVSRGLIQRTSELDLKVIQLFGLHFDTLETIASIPPAWSTLTELRLTHGYIGVGRLPYFARLPKLRWLALPISFANDGVPLPKFYVDHAYNLALHTFETTEARAPLNAFADPMLVARSLLSLWPNLRSVVCPNLDKISPSQSTNLVNGFIEALNVSILAHSEAIAQLSWSGMSGGEAQ